MSETQKPENNLKDEFHKLGQNLAQALRSAWDSPDRQRLQREIEDGLSDAGKTIRAEVEYLQGSPTAQSLKSDAEDLKERVRSSELEHKVRQELLSALQTVNSELEKFSQRITAEQAPINSPDESEEGGVDA